MVNDSNIFKGEQYMLNSSSSLSNQSFNEIAIQNANIYVLLFEFEITMKEFVFEKLRQYLEPHHNASWKKAIYEKLGSNTEQKLKISEDTAKSKEYYLSGVENQYSDDSFLNFSFIREVCIAWWDQVFKTHLRDKVQFNAAMERIQIVRNGVAHCRPIDNDMQSSVARDIFLLLNLVHSTFIRSEFTPINQLKQQYETNSLNPYAVFNQLKAVFSSRSYMKKSWPLEEMLGRAKKVEAIGISINELTIKLDQNFFIDSLLRGTEYTLIMLDPMCKYNRLREKEEETPKGSNKRMTLINLNYLSKITQELKSSIPSIKQQLDVSIYKNIPRYNLLFIDDEHLFVQYYAAYTRGEDNPCYYIKKDNNKGVYNFYREIYNKAKVSAKSLPDNKYKPSFLQKILY
jgi:hypothetical protein